MCSGNTYKEGTLVAEVTEILEGLNSKIRSEGVRISARKRKGFVYIVEEFSELKIPSQVIEWLNYFCVNREELPPPEEIEQLTAALALHSINSPQQLVDYWLKAKTLSTKSKRKCLKVGLGELVKSEETLPLHLKYWVNVLMENLESARKSDYEESIKRFKPLSDGAGVNSFIERSGGLSRSLERTLHFKRYQESIPVEEQDILFVQDLDVCLNIINSFIKQKHSERKTKTPLDFCVLCWRRVRHKQERVNSFTKERRDSNFYCWVHHPNRERNFSKQTLDALIAAVKAEKHEYADELALFVAGEMSDSSRHNHLTKWLKSFSPKSKLLTLHSIPKEKWLELSERIHAECADFYPAVYEKIKDIPPLNSSNFPEWFFKILDRLDESKFKKERIYWQTYGVREWTTFDGPSVEGWKVLLQIFRRYEANHYIMNRARPRGPQKSGPRPTTLKKQIENEIKLHQNKYGKVKTGLIVSKLETSRKSVAAVKKELGLNVKRAGPS